MRFIFLAALSVMLSACAHSQSVSEAHTSCADNPYLQKFDCSLSAVQQAAMQGDADAQYALGFMYYNGIDTTADKSAAMIWIHKAAVAGQPLALQAQRELDKDSIPGTGQAVMAKKSNKVMPKKHFVARKLAKTQLHNKISNLLSQQQQKYNNYAATKLVGHNTSGYVLQLMASPNLADVTAMQHTYGLSNSYVYTKQQGGKLWNVLVYGPFDSHASATQAASKLPAALRKLAPWPVRLSAVKQQLNSV